MYLPPSAEFLKHKIKQRKVLVTPLISLVHFDADYYISENPDLDSINKNDIHAHYIFSGYFENRLPFKDLFDFEFMRISYKDLAAFSDKKLIEHFKHFGYSEGRLPSLPYFDAEFYSSRYRSVIDANEYDIADERDLVRHFISVGYGNMLLPYAIGTV